MATRKSKVSVETFRSHAAEDALKTALQELGWKNITSSSSSASKGSCDIYWRGISHTEDSFTIPSKSYIARIPGISDASDKDELSKHIKRLQYFFSDDYSFYPKTWLLPEEQVQFDEYAQKKKSRGKTPTYIVKPDEGSQGEGIFLMQNPRDLARLRVPSIVQEYVGKPFLIRGLKFDLRLYVLVAGIDPPEVYICRSGMARFCTVPYEAPSVKNMHHTLMHLTNYSLNKRSKDFVHSEDGEGGSKQMFASVLRDIEAEGHSSEEVWTRIEDLVCKTVVALLPQLIVEEKSYMVEGSLKQPLKGFQLLGFDVLLDHKLHPHLLEVNSHPSLRVDFEQPKGAGVVQYVPSPVDMAIKLPAVKDTLRIIAAKIKKNDVSAVVSESSFVELLPTQIGQFSHLRLFERCAHLFNKFVGVKGGLKLGSTAFRNFVRTCKLCTTGFTHADVDILYIEMCRNHSNTYERNALSFHGFCATVMAITKRLRGEVTLASIALLLDDCEAAVAST